jgi:hypothetical protein
MEEYKLMCAGDKEWDDDDYETKMDQIKAGL